MRTHTLNSLIGIPDYDGSTNLSTYLISHGWNADHAVTAEEVLSDLDEGVYRLVVLEDSLLVDSQWTLDEYLEEIPAEVSVLVLTQGPSDSLEEVHDRNLAFLKHPFSDLELRYAVDRITHHDSEEDEGGDEDGWNAYEEDEYINEDETAFSF